MGNEEKCKGCIHAKDLKGCASKHVTEARKLITKGKTVEADQQLESLESRLKSEK